VLDIQLPKPELLILNELINSKIKQLWLNLLRIVNLLLVKLTNLIVIVLFLHELVKICVQVVLNMLWRHRIKLGQQRRHL